MLSVHGSVSEHQASLCSASACVGCGVAVKFAPGGGAGEGAGGWQRAVLARAFPGGPSAALCIIKCRSYWFSGRRRICFCLHVVCVDSLFQKWHIRFSRPGLAALAAPWWLSWARGRGEPMAFHAVCHVLLPLVPMRLPEEFRITNHGWSDFPEQDRASLLPVTQLTHWHKPYLQRGISDMKPVGALWTPVPELGMGVLGRHHIEAFTFSIF